MSRRVTSARRIALKFPAQATSAGPLDLEPYIGLFHRFIQDKRLEGLLIDVADYAHVVDGPGILLVGHEVDYGIDLAGGSPGLLVTRKRTEGRPVSEVLEDALRKALVALLAIGESEVDVLRFRTDGLQIQILDRLVAPNDAEAWEALRSEVEPVLARVFGDAKLEIVRDHGDDPRRPLAFRVTAQEAPPADVLLERLGRSAGSAPAAGVPAAEAQSPWDISVEELARLRESGAEFVLLDVREPHEFEICHLEGRLIPLGTLPQRISELEASAHVVVHCRSGGRSARAVELLRASGFENAWNLHGGILAWIERIDPSLTRY